MFIKSIAVAIVAVAASVAAQGGAPAYTTFTNPVGDSHTYTVGQKVTFSWDMACVPPSTKTSKTPKFTNVSLLNLTDTNNAYFIRDVTTIDCSKSSGNEPWVVFEVPDMRASDKFSLRIELLPLPAYSGKFSIIPAGVTPDPTPIGGSTLTIVPMGSSTLTPAPTGGSTPAPAPTGGKDEPKSAAGLVVPALSAAALIASAAAVLF